MIVPLVVIRCHSLSLDVSLVCLFINDREKLAISKLFFSKFKKFVSSSVFGELQLTQISSNSKTSFCNLKIRGLAAKLYLVFLLFQFRKQLWCFKINKLFIHIHPKDLLMLFQMIVCFIGVSATAHKIWGMKYKKGLTQQKFNKIHQFQTSN